MKKQYDFTDAKRGPVAPAKGKSRITIMLDDVVLEAARERADAQGMGYQTLVNGLLRDALGINQRPTATTAALLCSEPVLIVNEFNRRNIEALEAQLLSLAGQLQMLLGDSSKVS